MNGIVELNYFPHRWISYTDSTDNMLYFIQPVDGGLEKNTTANGRTCDLAGAGSVVRGTDQ